VYPFAVVHRHDVRCRKGNYFGLGEVGLQGSEFCTKQYWVSFTKPYWETMEKLLEDSVIILGVGPCLTSNVFQGWEGQI
jgi:hypothetical protein